MWSVEIQREQDVGGVWCSRYASSNETLFEKLPVVFFFCLEEKTRVATGGASKSGITSDAPSLSLIMWLVFYAWGWGGTKAWSSHGVSFLLGASNTWTLSHMPHLQSNKHHPVPLPLPPSLSPSFWFRVLWKLWLTSGTKALRRSLEKTQKAGPYWNVNECVNRS